MVAIVRLHFRHWYLDTQTGFRRWEWVG